jgi:hypothetical protein
MRARDVIHLVSALALDRSAPPWSHDTRLVDAARSVGLQVIAPA